MSSGNVGLPDLELWRKRIHSARNAFMGSMEAARRAGRYAASAVTAKSSAMGSDKAKGLLALISNSRLVIRWVAMSAPINPTPTPMIYRGY